ncbi:CinA family protein [Kitasatospora sp. DSM 101779]|uniref:CinA family protein n=1 Tax=Kitasatospora sp. DSM 101779 TaxID=2853165 RepID=UPI0021DA689A|nr:nicotinamide-nucleotide amidohydrolase family protein [Kitasatospora sp. DSM 101779]MCU7820277.1 nicotinamide-nucleotide amidohydrolase family protein [Kitasatospora sp. DSM 101779]
MALKPSACTSGLDRAGVLVRQITAALTAAGHTVAAAESLTGGRLCAQLCEAPGASAAFRGGIVAYVTDLKEELLGVEGDLLARVGAVHPEVAARMAEGVRHLARATYGVATTGVAGPAPQDGCDVGTVFVAVSGPRGTTAVQAAPGTRDRGDIQHAALLAALELLRDALRPPG